jgi:YD repeat-containing protein
MSHSTFFAVLLLSACVTLSALAQGPQLVALTPPSPTPKAFQKYGDIPVSAYTGVPNISIPLYTAKFRDISVPISLSYHSSGIKVSEEATDVGLGWVLNAGGNLNRNIIGYDDFDGGTYFNGIAGNNIMDFANGQGPTNVVQTGCSISMFNRNIANNPTLYNYDISGDVVAAPPFDFQPDQYYYNFIGHSGKFILLRNKQAVIQNQEKIQIYPTAADGSTWEVKTADGFTYDFNSYESYHDNEFTTGGTASTHITTWYLTQITSPLGNAVTFTYTPTSNYVQTVGGYSETRDDWQYVPGYPTAPTSGFGWQKGFNPSKQYYSQQLSSINFTTGQVVFYYSFNRQDVPGDSQLDSIAVFRTGATVPDKTFDLVYSYFTGTTDPSFNLSGNVTPQQSLRLKLNQVIEKGYYNGQYTQNPPYTFTYNEDNLPAKTSFARDHWGYYNGVTGRTTLIPDAIPLNATDPLVSELGVPGTQRDANIYWTPAFILTQMNYPTGGHTTFDYESNDFDEAKSEVNDYSYFAHENIVLQASADLIYDVQEGHYESAGQTLDLTNEYQGSDGSYTPVTLAAAFRLTGDGGDITGANCNDIQLPANVLYFDLLDANGNNYSHVDPGALPVCTTNNSLPATCIQCQNGPVFAYYQTYSLPPGVYTWRVTLNDPQNQYFAKIQDVHAIYNWYQTPAVNNNLVQGGGLRIMRITDHDGINEANNKIKHYVYDYTASPTKGNPGGTFSYGRRMSKPEYYYFKLSYDAPSMANGSGCLGSLYYTAHLMRSSDSEIPLNGSAAGCVVGYDQVTELEGDNGQYGQKVYQYINNPDVTNSYPESYTGLGVPLSPPYSSNVSDMTNGSLLSETDYVNNGGALAVVRQANNHYQTVNTSGNEVYGLTNQQIPVLIHGDGCSVPETGPCTSNIVMTYPALISQWNIHSQSEEKLYDQTNAALLSDVITNYYYDNPNHLQLTRQSTTNSKGELLTTYMQYPLDFTNVTATDAFTQGIANLQNKFIVNAPVEKYSQRSNSDGSNNRTTSAVLTYFNTGAPTPSTAYQTQVTAPLTNFTATTTGGSGVVANPAYVPQVAFDAYDSYGNVLQQHKVNGMPLSYCWDYNASLPICEVHNAAQADIAYTSFEADGSGNWAIPPGGITRGTAITGTSSYNLSNGSITRSGLSPSNTYVVSYWSGAYGSYSVSGTTKITAGKHINGWTYFEHTVTGVSSLSITGGGGIDELRLYPAAAQMTTYTYDPLIGITSQCDVGNRITYYDYDALGRLSDVKDQDGNILKTYQYHYQGQTTN